MNAIVNAKTRDGDPRTQVSLNAAHQTVMVNGKPCRLTMQEYLLISEFARNSGLVLTRDDLLKNVWGFQSPGKTRTVDVHVQRLRRKLGAFLIETVHGKGYRMSPRAEIGELAS